MRKEPTNNYINAKFNFRFMKSISISILLFLRSSSSNKMSHMSTNFISRVHGNIKNRAQWVLMIWTFSHQSVLWLISFFLYIVLYHSFHYNMTHLFMCFPKNNGICTTPPDLYCSTHFITTWHIYLCVFQKTIAFSTPPPDLLAYLSSFLILSTLLCC